MGDILRVKRNNNIINYYQNEGLVYTSEIESTTDLIVDATLLSTNSSINNGRTSFTIPIREERLGFDVEWAEGIDVAINDNSLTSATAGWGGAASRNKLLSGQDGWAEMTVIENTTHRYFGLSTYNKDTRPATIGYTFLLYSNKTLYIDEKGVRKITVGHYFEGDILSIERKGNTINYYRNNRLVYTSETESTTDLIVDATMLTINSTINNVRTSFKIPERKLRPGQNVIWTNEVSVEKDFNTLKSSTGSWGGAASKNKLLAGRDGWVEMTVEENTTHRYLGLSAYNKDIYAAAINYAFLLYSNKTLYIDEKGVRKITVGNYFEGDILSIERKGNIINYYRNDRLVYTSETESTTDLIVDAALVTLNGTIKNARASFGVPKKVERGFPIVFEDEIGVEVSNNSLTKTAGTSWSNAGAASKNQLAANKDGWIQVTAGETDKALNFGFTAENTNNTEADIDYGLRLYSSGSLTVMEKGVSKGGVGNFYPDDIVSIERVNGMMLYKKNGALLYTSAAPTNDALIFDAMLLHQGAVLKNARASFLYPCDTDTDGDGICVEVDCDDNDPNVPRDPKAECDDGDPNTISDVIQDDGCTCLGEVNGNTIDPSEIHSFFIPDDYEQDTNIRYSDGKVVIGNDSIQKKDGYKLFVEDGILTEGVVIAVKNTNQWADYVFEKDYPLKSVLEVANYIKNNKHLPNVPSAKEVISKGINLGKMDATLLRQIEELWLHVIRQEEELLSLKKDNRQLQGKVIQLSRKE